jgi:hypothetical protein
LGGAVRRDANACQDGRPEARPTVRDRWLPIKFIATSAHLTVGDGELPVLGDPTGKIVFFRSLKDFNGIPVLLRDLMMIWFARR